MTQPSLTDFLIARLAEDEAVARAAAGDGSGQWASWNRSWDTDPVRDIAVDGARIATVSTSLDEHIARHDPARVLADVEAKRKIVERCAYATQDSFAGDYDLAPRCDLAWDILCDLASVFADHPDYRAEWRP